jgi:hypothetical protein
VLIGCVAFLLALLLPSVARASGLSPVAEAGIGLLAYPGDEVELNGEGSSDPEGDALTYEWTQTGGAEVPLSDTGTPYPLLQIPEDGSVAGTLRFTLVVNDGTSDSAPDTVEIVVPMQVVRSVESGCSAAGGPVSASSWLLTGAAAAALLRRRARLTRA